MTEVTLAWIDRKTTVCSAEEAKALCADRRVSGRIVGAMAADNKVNPFVKTNFYDYLS